MKKLRQHFFIGRLLGGLKISYRGDPLKVKRTGNELRSKDLRKFGQKGCIYRWMENSQIYRREK